MIQWHPKTHRENNVILALMAGVILGMVPTAYVYEQRMPKPDDVETVMCLDLIERQAQYGEILGEIRAYYDSLDPAVTPPRRKPE